VTCAAEVVCITVLTKAWDGFEADLEVVVREFFGGAEGAFDLCKSGFSIVSTLRDDFCLIHMSRCTYL